MIIDKDKRIQELEATVARLLVENADLKRRLGVNSENSSLPPSFDLPGAKDKSAKQNKGKKAKRGARKGHPKQNKELVPEEDVTELVELRPEVCPHCGETHFQDSAEPPLRDQFIDLPPVKPVVREIKRPVMVCTACGELSYASLPEGTPKHTFESGVVAMVGILTGLLNISKRKAHLMMTEVFHVPISLGSITECEKRLSNSLEKPYNEVLEVARAGEFGHADETGWPLGNLLRGWLWLLSNDEAAAFMVHCKWRSKSAAGGVAV